MAKKKKAGKKSKRSKKPAGPKCAPCAHYRCREEGKDCFKGRADTLDAFRKDEDLAKIARVAASVEADHYGSATRLEEIAIFARKAGFKHLGIAFCAGFREEAKVVHEMLKPFFKVSSACCKCGGLPKEALGLARVRPEEQETMCNPLGQAKLLNEAGCELNLVLGLCVGHDALFTRASEGLVTTLVAKDRALGHNPVAAIYCPYVNRRLMEGVFSGNDSSGADGNAKKKTEVRH
jgi:uncharacterized metal-binding protein